MIKKSKKLIALLLAVITLFSATSVNLVAYAATKGTVYITNIPRGNDPKKDGWGHPALKLMNGWDSPKTGVTTIKAVGDYEGNCCYCIEPGVSLASGSKLTKKSESFWNSFPSKYNKTIDPDTIKLLVGRIMQYGYTGKVSLNWKSNNKTGADNLSNYMATQILIWETIVGERDADFKKIDAKKSGKDNVKQMIKSNNPLKKQIFEYYDSIEEKVKAHTVAPSFTNKDKSKAKTIEMTYDGKEYTATLTDSNKVLSKYSFSGSGMTITKSGNKLIIKTKKAPTSAVTITAKKDAKRKGIIAWTDGNVGANSKGLQDIVTYDSAVSDPVQAYVKVKVSTGSVKLVKTSTDGKVANIKFHVKGSGIDKDVATNSKGEFQLDNLKAGKYTITESVASNYNTPDITYGGKTVKAKSVVVTVSAGKTATVTFKNSPVVGSLEIKKVNNSNKPLEGAEFTVYTSDNKVYKKLVTDKDGKASAKGIPYGTYKLTETKAPKGYVLQSITRTFSVNNTKSVFSYTFTNAQVNEPPKGVVYLFKYDKLTDITKAGAVFDIYANEDIIGEDNRIAFRKGDCLGDKYQITIDDNGFGQSDALYPGKYYAVEIKAPDGYVLDSTPQYFEIKGDKSINYTPNVTVKLEDAEKYIKHETDKTTDGASPIPTETETTEPTEPTQPEEPEQPSEPDKIEYSYGKVTVDVSNAASSGNKVWGATVSCYYVDDEGKDILVGTGITDDKGQIVFENIAIGEQYKFVQKANFNTNFDINEEEQFFKLSEDSTEQTVSIKNTISDNATAIYSITQLDVYDEPITVTFHKKDEATLEGLPNAKITIFDADGNYYTSGMTDENGAFRVTAIPAGTYRFEETAAPSGYAINTTVFEITIDEYGKVVGETTILDKKTEVVLHKTDVTTAAGIPGARIEIYDKDGNTVFEDITDDDGNMTISGLPTGTYTFKETAAPDGYILNTEEFTFTINEDGTVTGDNTITDKPTTVIITKIDKDTLEALEGVEFEFFDGNGKSIGKYVTDENGQINLSKIPVGTYTYKETKCLDGYVLDENTYTFTIDEYGNITGDVTVKNIKADVPEEPEKPDTPDTPDTPKTGDKTNVVLYFITMLSALAGMILLTRKIKKAKSE